MSICAQNVLGRIKLIKSNDSTCKVTSGKLYGRNDDFLIRKPVSSGAPVRKSDDYLQSNGESWRHKKMVRKKIIRDPDLDLFNADYKKKELKSEWDYSVDESPRNLWSKTEKFSQHRQKYDQGIGWERQQVYTESSLDSEDDPALTKEVVELLKSGLPFIALSILMATTGPNWLFATPLFFTFLPKAGRAIEPSVIRLWSYLLQSANSQGSMEDKSMVATYRRKARKQTQNQWASAQGYKEPYRKKSERNVGEFNRSGESQTLFVDEITNMNSEKSKQESRRHFQSPRFHEFSTERENKKGEENHSLQNLQYSSKGRHTTESSAFINTRIGRPYSETKAETGSPLPFWDDYRKDSNFQEVQGGNKQGFSVYFKANDGGKFSKMLPAPGEGLASPNKGLQGPPRGIHYRKLMIRIPRQKFVSNGFKSNENPAKGTAITPQSLGSSAVNLNQSIPRSDTGTVNKSTEQSQNPSAVPSTQWVHVLTTVFPFLRLWGGFL